MLNIISAYTSLNVMRVYKFSMAFLLLKVRDTSNIDYTENQERYIEVLPHENDLESILLML